MVAMRRRLLRFLPDDAASWIEASESGRPGAAREGLPPPDGEAELWVAVPAEEVLLLTIPRPPGSARQLARALPYVIEERLAAPVETQCVAWAPAAEAGHLRVAVLDRARLRQWLARLAEAGLEPDALVPEPLLLPYVPGRASLLVEGERALLRYGQMQAFCGRIDEIEALGLVETEAIDEVDADRALQAMTAALTGPPPLNLLQGEFEPRRRRRAVRGPWRRVAALAAGVALLGFGHALAEWWALSSRVDAQRREMAALYLQAVPGATQVVDAEHQLRVALGGAGGDDLALRLLATAAPVLAAAPGVQLDALEFGAGQLELVLLAPDVAGLDALRARLAGAGLGAELSAATPGSRGVEGRLRLRVGGA